MRTRRQPFNPMYASTAGWTPRTRTTLARYSPATERAGPGKGRLEQAIEENDRLVMENNAKVDEIERLNGVLSTAQRELGDLRMLRAELESRLIAIGTDRDRLGDECQRRRAELDDYKATQHARERLFSEALENYKRESDERLRVAVEDLERQLANRTDESHVLAQRLYESNVEATGLRRANQQLEERLKLLDAEHERVLAQNLEHVRALEEWRKRLGADGAYYADLERELGILRNQINDFRHRRESPTASPTPRASIDRLDALERDCASMRTTLERLEKENVRLRKENEDLQYFLGARDRTIEEQAAFIERMRMLPYSPGPLQTPQRNAFAPPMMMRDAGSPQRSPPPPPPPPPPSSMEAPLSTDELLGDRPLFRKEIPYYAHPQPAPLGPVNQPMFARPIKPPILQSHHPSLPPLNQENVPPNYPTFSMPMHPQYPAPLYPQLPPPPHYNPSQEPLS